MGRRRGPADDGSPAKEPCQRFEEAGGEKTGDSCDGVKRARERVWREEFMMGLKPDGRAAAQRSF